MCVIFFVILLPGNVMIVSILAAKLTWHHAGDCYLLFR